MNAQHPCPRIHAVSDVFWKVWRRYGESGKHGVYESTWMALDQVLLTIRGKTMAQAFDDDGKALGPELFADTPQEAFDEIMKKHEDAAEYRVRKLRESIPDENKLDLILDRLDAIDRRLDHLSGADTPKLADLDHSSE